MAQLPLKIERENMPNSDFLFKFARSKPSVTQVLASYKFLYLYFLFPTELTEMYTHMLNSSTA